MTQFVIHNHFREARLIPKTILLVLVWIHGGGYGVGQGNADLSAIISETNNSFIGVVIQYRVSASNVWTRINPKIHLARGFWVSVFG